MANDLLTMSDLVGNTFDASDAMVSDVLQDAPLLSILPLQQSSKGDTHKYVKQTAAPSVGFRAENAGRAFDHATESLVTVTLKIMDFSWAVDKAVADAWVFGREDLINKRGMYHLKAAMFKAEQQVIYGTVEADSDGFAGLANITTVDDNDDSMVVDATGTSSGAGTSVFAVRLGDNDVSMVTPDLSAGIELGETREMNIVDGSGDSFPAYWTPACLWLGLQVGSTYSVGRICNLTTETGKELTDSLLQDVTALFPAGRGPTHYILSRQSRKQLQQSRTATNTTGAAAPTPTDFEGRPLITTDAVINTETLLTAA